ncbi:MAG: hypothetical protein ACXWEW_11865, partial [Nitrososphaeraceae archaeon]
MLKNIGCAVSSTNYENDIKFLDSTHNIKRFEIEIPSVTAFQAFDLKHFSEFKDAHKEYTFSIHIPYTNGIYKTGDNYNYFQIDNELDNKILNRMIREIQKLGNISHVVIHQWNHLSPRSPNVLNYLMDQVDELTVCIENYQVDKIEQMDWIKQYDNYPNLKLNVDLGHLICSPKRTNSIEDWIENFDSHI